MAVFTNQATLTYNGNTALSNVVRGEIREILSAVKTANEDTYYAPGDRVTYVVTTTNTSDAPLTNITMTDNLGQYTTAAGTTVTPLDYIENSVLYLNNGTLQPAPAVTSENPLTVTGITVPAGGTATIIYQATTNEFASPLTGGSITNTATFTGAGVTTPASASATVNATENPALTVTKEVSPTVVNENGTLTYTFTIQNYSSEGATTGYLTALSDTFNPVLNPISVTFNGAPWTQGTDYNYTPATGYFETVEDRITVPAATTTVDPVTGAYVTTPGVSTLIVSGTV